MALPFLFGQPGDYGVKERGLGSNGTRNRVKESRRGSDDHVPGVHRSPIAACAKRT